MAYAESGNVAANVDQVLAAQYNNLRAEVKAAVEGLQLHNIDVALTFGGGPGSDQLSVITLTDNQADANLDIDCAATMTFDANGFPTQVAAVLSALGITLTGVFTIANGKLTAIARTLS